LRIPQVALWVLKELENWFRTTNDIGAGIQNLDAIKVSNQLSFFRLHPGCMSSDRPVASK
jgi:hypothetical protein